MKYVLVTGGVVSGLGKGVTASSIGVLLKACGHRVTSIKIDPYLNVDAGTMSPFEHGEVFVLDDGGEADLDLGNYERFLDLSLSKDNNLTTGKIYSSDWIERVAHVPVDGRDGCPEVCVIELGGTVGDIESMPFIEALRQFQFRVGPGNMCVIHVSLVPVIGVVGEEKTKPTQHSVATLRSLGLNPHLLACRSQAPLGQATKDKLALFCHVPANQVLTMHDVSNIWRVPEVLEEQNAHKTVCDILGLKGADTINLKEWKSCLAAKWDSLTEHACLAASRKLKLEWVEAGYLEESALNEQKEEYESAWKRLKEADGILVPGGFGGRGVEGKILAAQYARQNNKPYLGICLGMQIAVIEFARNVMGWDNANSAEIDPATPHPVVVFMPEGSTTHKGGTMRLGTRRTVLQTVECIAAKLYQTEQYIDERHRHRYEVNPELVPQLEEGGLRFVGRDETGTRMEIVELLGHKYYVAAQFHPEFQI
eukprot:jgi/Picre1/29438/NNA_004826.t1